MDRYELSEYTTQELEKEIKIRKESVPEELTVKDWTNVEDQAKGIVKSIRDGGYADDDDPHYLFEAVMETVYGKEIWKWYNRRV